MSAAGRWGRRHRRGRDAAACEGREDALGVVKTDADDAKQDDAEKEEDAKPDEAEQDDAEDAEAASDEKQDGETETDEKEADGDAEPES